MILLQMSIFLARDQFPVYWAHYSILAADLTCLEQLLHQDKTWTFFMNLAGVEMPAHSVERLETMLSEDTNSIIQSDPGERYRDRLTHSWKLTEVEQGPRE